MESLTGVNEQHFILMSLSLCIEMKLTTVQPDSTSPTAFANLCRISCISSVYMILIFQVIYNRPARGSNGLREQIVSTAKSAAIKMLTTMLGAQSHMLRP